MVGRRSFPFEKAYLSGAFAVSLVCVSFVSLGCDIPILVSFGANAVTAQPISNPSVPLVLLGHAVRHAMLGLGHKKSDQSEMLDYDNLYLYQLMFFGNEAYSIHINNQQNGYRL